MKMSSRIIDGNPPPGPALWYFSKHLILLHTCWNRGLAFPAVIVLGGASLSEAESFFWQVTSTCGLCWACWQDMGGKWIEGERTDQRAYICTSTSIYEISPWRGKPDSTNLYTQLLIFPYSLRPICIIESTIPFPRLGRDLGKVQGGIAGAEIFMGQQFS